MIIELPALNENQEMALVDWKRLKSYDLRPTKAHVRVYRSWPSEKQKYQLPDGILPRGYKKKTAIMTIYKTLNNIGKPMELSQKFDLDPKNPAAIHNLHNFLISKWPLCTFYLYDLWLLNLRDGIFKDKLLQFHLTKLETDPDHGRLTGLALWEIDGICALKFPCMPEELRSADNGYADDKCKRLLGDKPKIKRRDQKLPSYAACGILR